MTVLARRGGSAAGRAGRPVWLRAARACSARACSARACSARACSAGACSARACSAFSAAAAAGRRGRGVLAAQAQAEAREGGSAPPPAGTPPPPPPPPPVAEPKVDFQKLMAPGGLAPERINGRAAMLAFVAAAGAELGGAGSVYDQLGHGGFGAMVKVILVVAAASFVPIARGKSGKATFLKGSDPLRVGRFNADVELLNGRAAMVGFAFLLVAEAFTHQAFL